MDEPSSGASALQERFLGRIVSVELRSAPRIFVGKLVCVDTHANAILHDSTEYVRTPSGELAEERFVPLLMVPGADLGRISVKKEPSSLLDMPPAQHLYF